MTTILICLHPNLRESTYEVIQIKYSLLSINDTLTKHENIIPSRILDISVLESEVKDLQLPGLTQTSPELQQKVILSAEAYSNSEPIIYYGLLHLHSYPSIFPSRGLT